MAMILLALFLFGFSGVLAVLLRSARSAGRVGAGGCLAGCVVGLVPVVSCLAGHEWPAVRVAWAVPLGSFSMALDALSAWFAGLVLIVCGLAAIYGTGYLGAGGAGRRLGRHWLFYNLLVAGMLTVTVARNGVLFLVAWEVMSLASYFLVVHDDEQRSAREAGRLYLIATQIGTMFLLVLFVSLGAGGDGGLDFERFGTAAGALGVPRGVLFLLAVIGFGTKAGLVPLHVWLPEAHPAAPSHVSAVMSGVMIKTGVYGLLRILTFLGPPAGWWGWALIGIGIGSGVLGVLFALAQRHVKRLLAYSSVENIGIVAIGLGIGLLGAHLHQPTLSVLGGAGALLHVANHALFKGLLFMGAGAVQHATGTLDMDRLGGLRRGMPWTTATFVVGAAAICGMPVFNGFVSEFVIAMGALHGVMLAESAGLLWGSAVVAALGLIAGLAAACFTMLVGMVFLGEPRSAGAAAAHEVGWAMRLPPLVLAGACLLGGLCGPVLLRVAAAAAAVPFGLEPVALAAVLPRLTATLFRVSLGAGAVLGLVASLLLVRRFLLGRQSVRQSVTWDCGYSAPSVRMQYTATSFAQPLLHLFRNLLQTRRAAAFPSDLFPVAPQLQTCTPDLWRAKLYAPAARVLERLAARLRCLQHGRIQLYVLYIALTLLVLMVWKLK